MKANKPELVAAKYFKSLGFKVFDQGDMFANGHDFTIVKGKRTWRVEVKKVLKGNRCFLVKPVSEQRSKDDLIVMVLGNQVISIQPMADHLQLCSKDRSRRITAIVDIAKACK
jgi:hypothetical protein